MKQNPISNQLQSQKLKSDVIKLQIQYNWLIHNAQNLASVIEELEEINNILNNENAMEQAINQKNQIIIYLKAQILQAKLLQWEEKHQSLTKDLNNIKNEKSFLEQKIKCEELITQAKNKYESLEAESQHLMKRKIQKLKSFNGTFNNQEIMTNICQLKESIGKLIESNNLGQALNHKIDKPKNQYPIQALMKPLLIYKKDLPRRRMKNVQIKIPNTRRKSNFGDNVR